jgi:hypothetical protein
VHWTRKTSSQGVELAGGEVVRSNGWLWLLPLAAGAVAVWVVVARDDPAEVTKPAVEDVATFVAADASGNNHSGIIQGRVRMGEPGHDGSAYSFAERGSWVMVPSSPGLNPDRSNFLVSVWLQVESNPDGDSTYDLVRKGIAYTVPGEYKVELLGTGQVRCSAKDDAAHLAVVTSERPLAGDGSWHRIGCARTGAHWSVVVDESVTTTEVDLGSISNSVALSIGSKYGLEDRPLGLVDDVKLFVDDEETLTRDPVKAIQELEDLPPVAWWKLDEAATTGAAG